MKKFILYSLLLGSTLLYAQNTKKEILLDENGKVATEAELKKKMGPPDHAFLYSKIENDTAIFKKLVRRQEVGVISEQDRLKVIKEIQKITGTAIANDKTIIINFFYQDPTNPKSSCIGHYTSERSFKRFLSKNDNIAQFFITEKTYTYKKRTVVQDKYDEIRKMLFPYPIYCGNYIIIKPDGRYFRHLGEYRQDLIPKILEADWDLDSQKP